MSERGRNEKRSEEAVHAIVASDRPKQRQDYDFLRQALWAGNINISPMAIRAVAKSYSQHGFPPGDLNHESQKHTSQDEGGSVQYCSLFSQRQRSTTLPGSV
jgi:hypothetical protein